MKGLTKRKKFIFVLVPAVIIAAIAVILIKAPRKMEKMDTTDALVSVSQDDDTIAFYRDSTYSIQGDVEIQGVTFDCY